MTDAHSKRHRARSVAEEPPRSGPRHPLVGREGEIAELDRSYESTLNGHGCTVLISGEPGIGKTRLAEEVTARAIARGAIVVSGHCVQADGAPPYWPWTECARMLNRMRPLKELVLPASVTERLSALLPELRDGLPPSQRPVSATTVSGRFHLFDAVRTLLQRASSVAPVVLILEDIHHADPSSLLLLEFLARELRESRLLMLITCREDELSPRMRQTLGELARVGLHSLRLAGLTGEAARDLMTRLSASPCPDDIARLIHARTAGNPFFLTELAQLKPLDADAVPDNVRSAVRARLGNLADVTRRLLTVASVMGCEFDFRIVGAVVAAAGEAELLHALDEALERLFIAPISNSGESQYQFRHALIRDALYDGVSPSRRANWHAAIVEQLERRSGVLDEQSAGELAYHAALAESLVGAARVSRYSRLAGERMLSAHAFGEALTHFARAWRTHGATGSDDDAAAILAGLGYAQAATTVRWNREEAWGNLRRALEHYLRRGDMQRVVALATHASLPAEGVSGVADAIEPLLRIVPDGSCEAGALISRQAAARYFENGDHAAAHRGFSRALSIAAKHHDLALELRIHAQATSVDHFALRWHDVLTRSGQVLALARRVDDLHSETYARYRAAFVLLHFGRVADARIEAGHNLAVAERLRDRGLLADALYAIVLIAQCTGHWSEARANSDRGLALEPGHLPLLHARAVLEYETGDDRAGESYLQRLVEADREAHPYPLAGVFTALGLAQIGCVTDGRCELEAAAAAARMVVMRPSAIANAVVSARLARGLFAVLDNKREQCESEIEALEPVAPVMPIQWCLATRRVLGLLAHTAGQRRRALAHFEAASRFCRESGFTPELAWTCYNHAAALLESATRQERRQAAALLDEGQHAAEMLGLVRLVDRIATFRQRYRTRLTEKPAGLTPRELEVLHLLAEGMTNKEIAQALFISTYTVNVHVARVLQKTGASNRTEAAACAARLNLLESTGQGLRARRPRLGTS